MKSLIIGPKFHYFNLSVERAFHALGYETRVLSYDNPVHPYTRSLLSAIPVPDPIVEKKRVAEAYDYKTSGIDYNTGTEHHISGSHYVFGTDSQIAKWTK